MFQPKTKRIEYLAELFPDVVSELKTIFAKQTVLYIDYANVLHWQDRLGWHIDRKRLKQFLDSFSSIAQVKLYYGTLSGDGNSKAVTQELKLLGYQLRTKPVKIMRFSIDTSSIPDDSPALLKSFMKSSLLSKLDIQTIQFLNRKLEALNKQGIKYIEDRKCNFDVEIGRDMLLDFHDGKAESFVLWSGDSDFAEPIEQLMLSGNAVYLFATARRVSVELANTGVPIFDIKKIKEFICFPREIPQVIKSQLDSKQSQRDSLRSP